MSFIFSSSSIVIFFNLCFTCCHIVVHFLSLFPFIVLFETRNKSLLKAGSEENQQNWLLITSIWWWISIFWPNKIHENAILPCSKEELKRRIVDSSCYMVFLSCLCGKFQSFQVERPTINKGWQRNDLVWAQGICKSLMCSFFMYFIVST